MTIHNTVFTGKVLYTLPEVDSTNRYMRWLMENTDLAEGTVVWARNQFAGRGQGQHVWQSESGKNLTCTVLYKPVFLAPSGLFSLNRMVSLALYDLLADLLPQEEVTIKWPNDILVNNLKVAGILIETTLTNRVEAALIGVGLNLQQTHFEGLPRAASLCHFTDQALDPSQVLEKWLSYLEAAYLLWRRQPEHQGMAGRYATHLYGKDTWRWWLGNHQTFEALLLGVDDAGNLMLQNRIGQVQAWKWGQVQWVW